MNRDKMREPFRKKIGVCTYVRQLEVILRLNKRKKFIIREIRKDNKIIEKYVKYN